MIRFEAGPGVTTRGVEIEYDDGARSFLTSGAHAPVNSILVNDLEVHFDADGRVLSVDGYAPREAWVASDASPPTAGEGEIRVHHSGDLVSGASIRLTSPTGWPSYFNSRLGWLCVGSKDELSGGRAIRINPGTILIVRGDELVSIWLRVEQGRVPPPTK